MIILKLLIIISTNTNLGFKLFFHLLSTNTYFLLFLFLFQRWYVIIFEPRIIWKMNFKCSRIFFQKDWNKDYIGWHSTKSSNGPRSIFLKRSQLKRVNVERIKFSLRSNDKVNVTLNSAVTIQDPRKHVYRIVDKWSR